MSAELIELARKGDEQAFRKLVEPHRREIQVHCYRILGSIQDAEDALQETLLSAWQGLAGFEERASVRTWLYRIATNRCLNALRSVNRKAPVNMPALSLEPPEPTRMGEVFWLEPYPDVLLAGVAETSSDPEARYSAKESISLAFITALQLLPPRQRAVLILRDVLGFRAGEVARMVESSEESVTSALKRARSAVRRRAASGTASPPAPDSPEERALVDELTLAYETGDLDRLVALFTEDVRLAMPPIPFEYQGRDVAARFFAAVAFRDGRTYRVVPTRANMQPALACYLADPSAGVLHAVGIHVITFAGDRISAITHFYDSVFGRFGLPRTVPA